MTINRRNLNLGQHYTNAQEVKKSEEVEIVKAEEQEIVKSEPTDIEKAFGLLSGGIESSIEKSEVSDDDDIEKAEGGKGGKVIGHTKSGKAIYAGHEGASDYSAEDHSDAMSAHQSQAAKLKDSHPDKSASHSGLAQSHSSAMHSKLNKSEDDDLNKSESESFNDIMKSFESGALKSADGNTVDSREEALQIALVKGESEEGFLGNTASGKAVYEDITKSENFTRQDHLDAWLIFKSQIKSSANSRQVTQILEKSNYHQNQADHKLFQK